MKFKMSTKEAEQFARECEKKRQKYNLPKKMKKKKKAV